MKPGLLNRRQFVRHSLAGAAAAAAATALNPLCGWGVSRASPKVAIVGCQSYGSEVRKALDQAFELLGGIKRLVSGKTVTVKLNLTGSDFSPFLGRPVGETFMTHYAAAHALTAAFFAAGARRVRLVESTQRRDDLRQTLTLADWDVRALESAGAVEFENTRNLGHAKSYSTVKVPGGGSMFSSFDFNHAYADTDVMVSLAKLKNHLTTGVTLGMKNLFGITPNSLYGNDVGNEEGTDGRLYLHDPRGGEKIRFPGLKPGDHPRSATSRVPRIIVDICAARPIHLTVLDGITSMRGGEGPWCGGASKLSVTTPGILVAGMDPVATDAVGTAVMGYDPRTKGKPFELCENHLVLGEQTGLGTARLEDIEVVGLPLTKARYPYD